MNTRNHLWLHGALAAAVLAVLGVSALGVVVPTYIVYLIVLACPAMMLVMLLGMGGHHHSGPTTESDEPDSVGFVDQEPFPRSGTGRSRA